MTAVAILYIPKWIDSISFKSVVSVPFSASDFPAKANSSINKKLNNLHSQSSYKKYYFQGDAISPKTGGEGTEKGEEHFCTKPLAALQEKRIFTWFVLFWYYEKQLCFEAHLFSILAIFSCAWKNYQNDGFKHCMGKQSPKCFILLLKQQYNIFLKSSTSPSHFLWFVLKFTLVSLNSSVNYAWRISLLLDWKQL